MDLQKGFAHRKFNFEETTYLLMFGALPDRQQLQEFIEILNGIPGAAQQICPGRSNESAQR